MKAICDLKLICRLPFRGPHSPFDPCPSPRGKVLPLLSHFGSVSELSLVSHTFHSLGSLEEQKKCVLLLITSYKEDDVTNKEWRKKLNKTKIANSQHDIFFKMISPNNN